MRSVVLFNVWDKPPVEVEREEPPEDATKELLASSRCEPRDAWSEAPRGEPAESGGTKTMKLWLLGDQARRGRIERTLPLRVDGERTLEALTQASACTRIEEIH